MAAGIFGVRVLSTVRQGREESGFWRVPGSRLVLGMTGGLPGGLSAMKARGHGPLLRKPGGRADPGGRVDPCGRVNPGGRVNRCGRVNPCGCWTRAAA
jgi:hypothetical protein